MRHLAFAVGMTVAVAMSSVALADQPADKPTNNGNQAVDCSELEANQSKNWGQVQQFVKENPEDHGDANSAAQFFKDLGAPVGESTQLVLEACGVGSEPS